MNITEIQEMRMQMDVIKREGAQAGAIAQAIIDANGRMFEMSKMLAVALNDIEERNTKEGCERLMRDPPKPQAEGAKTPQKS